jgi:hypothetical protein
VLGSFEISRFEYSLNGAGYTGNISGSATTFTFTGLVPSTSHTVRIRAVDASGQISDVSNQITRSTTAEIPPSAPSVTVTQKESSTGTPINATILDVSFGAASAGTYPVVYYQYQVYRGATLVTDWTTTPVGINTTFPISGLTPASSHTVYVRGVATANGTTLGASGSGTASTDTEIANSAPTVTITSQDTVNVTFSRSNSSGGTYGVSYYDWEVRNSVGSVRNSGTTTNTSLTVNAGVSPNETFTVYVRARSLISNLAGSYGTASGQLNPETPAAPTLSFSSQSASERSTAYLSWNATSYATQYKVFRNGVEYDTTSSTSYNVPISAGSNWNFFVRAGNRLNAFSGNSNTKFITTGSTGVPWSSTVSTAKYIQNYGDCVQGDSISSLIIQAPASASSSGDAGYYYIEKIGFEALKSSATSFGFSVGDSGTRPLYFQKTSGASPGGWGFGFYSIPKFPLSQTTGYFFEIGVNQGGSDISSVFFKLTTATQFGNNWGAYNSSCNPTIASSIIGRNIYLVGSVVTATTYS